MGKIYNQVMEGPSCKCLTCGEKSSVKLPIDITLFTDFLNAFIKLHTAKGCNKTKVKENGNL